MTEGSPLALEKFLPYRLSVASNMLSDLVATAYEALFALKIPEWRLVAVIAEGPAQGLTQQAIGLRTRMDKVTVSRAAAALIERGLVARAPNPDDGRSHLLTLSAAGRSLYAQVAPKALEIEAEIFRSFDTKEIAALHATLDRIEAEALKSAANR